MRKAEKRNHEIVFAPQDQTAPTARVELDDGTVLVVFRSPGATYAQLVDAQRHGTRAAFEVFVNPTMSSGTAVGGRQVVSVNPAQVVAVK